MIAPIADGTGYGQPTKKIPIHPDIELRNNFYFCNTLCHWLIPVGA